MATASTRSAGTSIPTLGSGLCDGVGAGGLARAWANGLEEVFAVVYAGNDASMAVCRRIGMTHLGPTSKYYDTELELFRIAASTRAEG